MAFLLAVTSLREITPGSLAVCLKLPPEHSFLLTCGQRFLLTETGSVNVSISPVSCHSSASRLRKKLLASVSAFTPFIVELFATELLTQIPDVVCHPTRLVTKSETPYASVVKRASQPPNPHDRICTCFAPLQPFVRERFFSVAQIHFCLELGRVQEFFCGDGESRQGLRLKAPIEPDKPLSRHPALRIQH